MPCGRRGRRIADALGERAQRRRVGDLARGAQLRYEQEPVRQRDERVQADMGIASGAGDADAACLRTLALGVTRADRASMKVRV
jgi:hypothetical protein